MADNRRRWPTPAPPTPPLVDECIRFARDAACRRLTLWTESELSAARRIYQQAGFRLTREQRHDSFARKNLLAETWDLTLSASRS